MTDAFLIPLKVFGLGFIISMCMALIINLLLNVIKHFTKNNAEKQ